MARKTHTEEEVLRRLMKKSDVRVNPSSKRIKLLSNKVWSDKSEGYVENSNKKHDLGNGSWGRIDFLVRYCGYTTEKVESFH
jgi:hypothetical protein